MTLKDRLWRCDRPSFTFQKATFYKTASRTPLHKTAQGACKQLAFSSLPVHTPHGVICAKHPDFSNNAV